ncbi:MAG: 30S ribosomal protein S16 [Gammaproteobacteria bacterium]
MVVIRMSRQGAKKRPFYRIHAAHGSSPRDGRYIERLGYFDPLAAEVNSKSLHFQTERLDYWLSQGARPSESVQRLIKEWKKLNTAPAAAPAPVPDATATDTAPSD